MKLSERTSALMPESLRPFFDKARALGSTPVLVGGAVRDICRHSEDITDWDFELFHPHGTDALWSKLQHQLKSDYRLNSQPHAVVKAQAPAGPEFEFAPPRVETFPDKEAYSHSDFETKVNFALPFTESVSRRDFTLNAMGFAWEDGGGVRWDPVEGLGALMASEPRPWSPRPFVRDPVRFLRAHRFAQKYGFRFSLELKDLLTTMNLEFLTGHYMAEEASKSGTPFAFWNALQWAESLPVRFQGGLASPELMQGIYTRELPKIGHSNALLAAAFHFNEGWHLLQPLGGKGEREVALWRERRELIRQLAQQNSEAILTQKSLLELVCRLAKSPRQWLREDWILLTLQALGIEWIGTRPWPEIDLEGVPPNERHLAKVEAWLKC